MENSAKFDEALFNTRRIFNVADTSEKLFDINRTTYFSRWLVVICYELVD